MVSEMAMEDIEALQADGVAVSPRDVVRLNAFGVLVERDREALNVSALPRCACLGGRVVFREPTISADVWLSKALRWSGDDGATFMLLRAFSMWCKSGELPDPDDSDRVNGAVNRFARDVVGEFTMREVAAAVKYAEDGCCHLDDEEGPANGDDQTDEMPTSTCFGHAVGLLNQGVFLKVGSVSDMSSMTVSQLEALVAMALRGDVKSERSRRLGDYYAVLDEIKERSSDPSETNAEDEDADNDQVENHADPPADAGELGAGSGA